jgi:hypothetical protein
VIEDATVEGGQPKVVESPATTALGTYTSARASLRAPLRSALRDRFAFMPPDSEREAPQAPKRERWPVAVTTSPLAPPQGSQR